MCYTLLPLKVAMTMTNDGHMGKWEGETLRPEGRRIQNGMTRGGE